MLVVINAQADSGRAGRRWARIRAPLRSRLGEFECFEGASLPALRRRLRLALEQGERRFVAVGGDGTVNRLVNLLFELAPGGTADLTVGAIGVGSSNDFHKPRVVASTIDGHPCRVNFDHVGLHDVGNAVCVDANGLPRGRRWLLNASVGTTAYGNWLYNRRTGLVGAARKVSATCGMAVAALRALCADRGRLMHVQTADRQASRRVHNLGIVKNPHFTGCLRYDSPYEPDSGDFFVHLLADATRWDVVRTVWGLAHGRFTGRAVQSWRGRALTVSADSAFPIELDGEVMQVRRAAFSLDPRALGVCRS